jgi:hypothetical protein
MDGHAHMLAINVLAPYQLTALVAPPPRLVYLSGGMHRGGTPSIDDLDWGRCQWNGAPIPPASCSTRPSRRRSPAGGPGCSATRWNPGGCPRRWAALARPTTPPKRTSPRPGWRSATTRVRSPAAATSITAHRAMCCPPSVPARPRMSCWTSWRGSRARGCRLGDRNGAGQTQTGRSSLCDLARVRLGAARDDSQYLAANRGAAGPDEEPVEGEGPP